MPVSLGLVRALTRHLDIGLKLSVYVCVDL